MRPCRRAARPPARARPAPAPAPPGWPARPPGAKVRRRSPVRARTPAASSGPSMAPAWSMARWKPKARPRSSSGATAASSASRGALRRPLPTPVGQAHGQDVPGGRRQGHPGTRARGQGVARQHQRLAPPQPVGQASRQQLEQGRQALGQALEQPQEGRAGSQHAGHEGRQQREDHLAAGVVEEAHQPQRAHVARQGPGAGWKAAHGGWILRTRRAGCRGNRPGRHARAPRRAAFHGRPRCPRPARRPPARVALRPHPVACSPDPGPVPPPPRPPRRRRGAPPGRGRARTLRPAAGAAGDLEEVTAPDRREPGRAEKLRAVKLTNADEPVTLLRAAAALLPGRRRGPADAASSRPGRDPSAAASRAADRERPRAVDLSLAELGRRLRARAGLGRGAGRGRPRPPREARPRLGAVVTLTRELALAQARQADDELRAGQERGPLHGIPYGAKDLLATRGIPTTWGPSRCASRSSTSTPRP